jgi:hypothetical protein
MENQRKPIEFKDMQPLFKHGDAPKLAEMTGKTKDACVKIIAGERKPQQWFMDAAEKYLRNLGRIE